LDWAHAGRLTALGLALTLCVTGCVATSVSVSTPTPLRQFLAASRANSARVYRLIPGDAITARFYFNPQLDEDLAIRPDGKISFSLVGEVMAAGKTAAELSADVTKAYAPYFVKPTAVVIVRQFTAHRMFTGGQVRNPRQMSIITGAHTVLESLAASGGVTDDGTLTHVFLIRRLPNQPRPMVAELDLAAALSGEDLTQDVTLMPDDYVFVPRSGAADFNLAMQQYVLRNLNLGTYAGASGYYEFNPTSNPPPLRTNTAARPGTNATPSAQTPSAMPTTPVMTPAPSMPSTPSLPSVPR
jgi:protein involved in polysaccharide export with SLBB domain